VKGNHIWVILGNCAALPLVLVYAVVQLVEVLCYKQEGHRFDLGSCHWTGVNLASNSNEYQEYFLGRKGGQFLGLGLFIF